MDQDTEHLLQWEGQPKTIPEFAAFRKRIKAFKADKALRILKNYASRYEFEGQTLYRFIPQQGTPQGRRNLGLFSTAACLEVIGAYREELNELNLPDDEDWTGKSIESRNLYFTFLLRGMAGEIPKKVGGEPIIKLGTLPKTSILVKLDEYLTHWGIRGTWLGELSSELTSLFHELLREIVISFLNEFLEKPDIIHPFMLYKFLLFLDKWKIEVFNSLSSATQGVDSAIRELPHEAVKRKILSLLKTADSPEGEQGHLGEPTGKSADSAKILFDSFFDEIYLWGKYELYRQMALKLSNDLALYDAKRLAYSLMIVSYKNRFTNYLIRDRALNILFEAQRDNPNDIWPTGQLLPLSQDGLMAVASIELASDLLQNETLFREVNDFLPELKAIYDFHARTMQTDGDTITGWYPPDQRDKTPLSHITAHVLSFIKRFCKLISFHLAETAESYFQLNKGRPSIRWSQVYDCSAAKGKLQLIGPISEAAHENYFRSAILFGPPGTGKTSLARALASRLDMVYFELTPGNFFGAGESLILRRINDIFDNMLHLQNALVFIDEIDDLVRSREAGTQEVSGSTRPHFDPRELYVNTILPRLQELGDTPGVVLVLGTNHFENVDPAIARIGRVDLVIPVGSLSPYGRLALLAERWPPNEWDIDSQRGDLENSLVDYLQHTNYTSHRELKTLLWGMPPNIETINQTLEKTNRHISTSRDKMKKFKEDLKLATRTSPYANIRPVFSDKDVEDADDASPGDMSRVVSLFLLLQKPHLYQPDLLGVNEAFDSLYEGRHFNLIGGFYDSLHSLEHATHRRELERNSFKTLVTRLGRLFRERDFI